MDRHWDMPVTARLSKAFYDRFGEQVANELVDWFNQMDATYRQDLRELNELNFARFGARLEQRLTQVSPDLREQMVVQMRRTIGMWFVLLVAVVGLWIRR